MSEEGQAHVLTEATNALTREFETARRTLEERWYRMVHGRPVKAPSAPPAVGKAPKSTFIALGRKHKELGIPTDAAKKWAISLLRQLRVATINEERNRLEENRRTISQTFFAEIQEAEESRRELRHRQTDLRRTKSEHAFIPHLAFLGMTLLVGLLLSAEFSLAEQVTRYALALDPPADFLLAFALMSLAYFFKHLADILADPPDFLLEDGRPGVAHRRLCVVIYSLVFALIVVLIFSMTQLRTVAVLDLLEGSAVSGSSGSLDPNAFFNPAPGAEASSEPEASGTSQEVPLFWFFGSAALLFPALGGMAFSHAKRAYSTYLRSRRELKEVDVELQAAESKISSYRQTLGQALTGMKKSLRLVGATPADLQRFAYQISWFTLGRGSKGAAFEASLKDLLEKPTPGAVRLFVRDLSAEWMGHDIPSETREMLNLYLDFLVTAAEIFEEKRDRLEEALKELTEGCLQEIDAGFSGKHDGAAFLEGVSPEALLHLADLKEFHRKLLLN